MQWSGATFINGKMLRPAWVPPAIVRRDKPNLPSVVPAGAPNNPVGAAVLFFGWRRTCHPRHQQSKVDRRSRVLWLHSDVQRRRARSLWPCWIWNDSDCDAVSTGLAAPSRWRPRTAPRCASPAVSCCVVDIDGQRVMAQWCNHFANLGSVYDRIEPIGHRQEAFLWEALLCFPVGRSD